MQLQFAKWHGTGNDFILVDDRKHVLPTNTELIRRLCHRHYGIGSDGLIALRPPAVTGTDFHMEFFNPDGSKSFCGNGSRCVFAFWSELQGGVQQALFTAMDGAHAGSWRGADVAIGLPAVNIEQRADQGSHLDFIHTGSPHLLVWEEDVEAVDVLEKAPPLRRSLRYGTGGTNVNFVQQCGAGIRMRTFERGVENETLSCGSGVVAAALGAISRGFQRSPVQVQTRGGTLWVEAEQVAPMHFEGIQLVGPVSKVFQGAMEI